MTIYIEPEVLISMTEQIPNTPSVIEATTAGPGAMPSGPPFPGGYGEGDGFRLSARTCLIVLPLQVTNRITTRQ